MEIIFLYLRCMAKATKTEEPKRIRKGLINFQGNEVVEKHLAFIRKKTGEKTDAEVIRRAIREDAEKRGFK